MSISAKTQAILLLTARFARAENSGVSPLTPTEWGRFAAWLKDKSRTPDELMAAPVEELLRGWSDRSITIERVRALLDRGSALALATERWLRSGLWVLTRSDSDYPGRLKEQLVAHSPPVLFGCGNRALLDGGGLAVVGSRNSSETELLFSSGLGHAAAKAGFSAISGGARGVDQAAMRGALEAEGTVVGVLSDSLLRASLSQKYRPYLMNGSLALISPFHPDAGFNVGNAMQRNKYIYCLADAAVVVHSGTKGGTWNGAVENLRKGWVPLWVKETDDQAAGNTQLVDLGARSMSCDIDSIDVPSLVSASVVNSTCSDSSWSHPPVARQKAYESSEKDVVGSSEKVAAGLQHATAHTSRNDRKDTEHAKIRTAVLSELDFYHFFLAKVRMLCGDGAKTPDEIRDALGVKKSQLDVWLKRAVEENRVRKLTRPVRYDWVAHQQELLSFDD